MARCPSRSLEFAGLTKLCTPPSKKAMSELHAQVFPSYTVKQVFKEYDIEREDDMVITSMQCDLLSKCTMHLLKSAVVSCICHKRKYISERDIHYAKQVCPFPCSELRSKDLGYLLDQKHLAKMCERYIAAALELLDRHIMEGELTVKISADMLAVFQEVLEACIRGFVQAFGRAGHASRSYGIHLFDHCMRTITGDPNDESHYTAL